MYRLGAIALSCAAAACYRPAAATSCAFRCGPSGECPSGLACFDGLCRASSTDTCGGVPDDSMRQADGPPDGDERMSDACRTFGSGLITYKYCSATLPAPLMLQGTFDTTTDCTGPNYVRTMMWGGARTCVAIASQIVVQGTLIVNGPDPFVLVSDDIDVMASITSFTGTGLGCSGTNSGTGGGGGAGGTADTAGGDGGDGGSGVAGASLPGNLTTIRGGCPGGFGDNAVGNWGLAGGGGGVLYLIGTQIELRDGVELLAPGLGGAGGSPGGLGGGGGGGAGGLVAIDTNMLTVGANVLVCAEGGGGGGGGTKMGTVALPTDGANGCSQFPSAPSGGTGASGGGGGAGGDGSTAATVTGRPGSAVGQSGAGGGGGGGGAGWIRAFGNAASALAAASVDPPAQ